MYDIQFVEKYFTEEKIESILFIIIGILSISFALIFWLMIKYSFYKGFAYPLLIIGFIQIIVGTTIYFRSPKDIDRVNTIILKTPEKIASEEIPRMGTVLKNFELYKWVEIALIILGSILYIKFYSSSLTFWKGLGLGLTIEATIMLALDLVAKHRATIYLEALSRLLADFQ